MTWVNGFMRDSSRREEGRGYVKGRSIKKLDQEYSSEIDSVSEVEWYEVLRKFEDSNIYQTWSYDAVRCGAGNLSHFVLKRKGEVIAAAQARVPKFPAIGRIIAYIRWGPLWRQHSEDNDVEALRQALRALRNEYVTRRGLVLRIYPYLFDDGDPIILKCFDEEGFTKNETVSRDQTLVVDLGVALEVLRKGFKQKWRNGLNRAEKSELRVIEGSDDELFEKFIKIYRQMLKRKNFVEPNDINEFQLIQATLPENCKMKIYLCEFKNEISAGAIFSAMGNTGVYLFGATNDIGLKSNGSYLLQWRFIRWLKENQFLRYDLNGINPELNPGTYQFKAGLSGKNGKPVSFAGQFDAYPHAVYRLMVRCGDELRTAHWRLKKLVNKVRHRKGSVGG
jgi:lipid II:glycine glycyltransferase (peptidoglycan interpeptide bridge formation enzyme)